MACMSCGGSVAFTKKIVDQPLKNKILRPLKVKPVKVRKLHPYNSIDQRH